MENQEPTEVHDERKLTEVKIKQFVSVMYENRSKDVY